jgi:hypothetical protein
MSEYWFDEAAATRAVAFFEQCLVHTKGQFYGRPFTLEGWQKEHIIRPLFGWKRADGTRRYRTFRLWVPRKNGKALELSTPIPTPSGWKVMGDIRIGDQVLGANGKPTTVVWESPVYLSHECFELRFSNGETVVADADHQWLTTARVDRPGDRCRKGLTPGESRMTRVRTTREIYATLTYGSRGDVNHSIAMPMPLDLPEADLPIDPYVLGAWLGDGASDEASLAAGDQDCGAMAAQIEACGYAVEISPRKPGSWRIHMREIDRQQMVMVGNAAPVSRNDPRNLGRRLRLMGLLHNKAIPALYLRASFRQRLALLQGLMDTDGHCGGRGTLLELVTVSEKLAEGYGELLASLGIKFSRREKPLRCNGRDVEGQSFNFQFWVSGGELPVFRLPRKLQRQLSARRKGEARPRSRTVQIVDCRQVPSVPVKCIAVDNADKLYLFGKTMLPTHNTQLGAGIGTYMMVCDAEQEAMVYSTAANEDQASLTYVAGMGMINASPVLKPHFETLKKNIVHPGFSSVWQVLTGRVKGKHGLNASCLLEAPGRMNISCLRH